MSPHILVDYNRAEMADSLRGYTLAGAFFMREKE